MDTEALNILVIEEDRKTIELLEGLSKETENYRLNMKYSDGLEDLTDQLNSNQADLLLINPMMNDGKGLNVFEFLRNGRISLPVLTIIHSNDAKDGLETLRLGAQDYIQRKDLNKETLFHSIVSSIERYKYTQPLIETEDKFQKVFFSLNEAILVSSLADGKIISCNPAAQKIFGYAKHEIMGKPVEMLHTDKASFESFHKKTIEILNAKGSYKISHKMRRKDGLIIDTEQRITFLKKSNDSEQLVISIINDITERKQIEQALIKAKENAEKSDELKTEFLAQVSHEIRTPINIITSNANHLREELSNLNISDDFKQSLRAIDKAGKRIIRTIDLILNMSEMLTGSYETQRHTMDLYLDILLDLFLRYRIYANRKNIELNIQKFTDDTEIKGDEYSINQIFLQLIDNAVKYTPEGKVEIRIKRDEFNRLSVEIEDTGIGISEDFMQKIFEPFTQEMHGPRREFEGNGLGLALIKKYCELNNAEIAIESKKSVGTKFTVTFSDQL
ncbi:MAG: ATP-binding protein [Bacteroidota bacterium]|nr:ATP-binding protein [Bacteroidota bacterium]MDP4194583.1 ATP-binding protein [Bacteroidota bacterium]